MKATATSETRQRMLLATTGLLAPIVLFLCWGLFDRFAPKPKPLFAGSQPDMLSREDSFKYERLRADLLEAGRRGDWGKVVLKAGEACGGQCPPRIAALQGEAYWRTGDRKKATKLWEPALISSSVASRADLLALAGDLAAYKAYVLSLSVKTDPELANDNAWAAVLLPDIRDDYTPIVALSEVAVKAARTADEQANALNTLGVALYRAGRFTEALTQLDQSEKLRPELLNMVFMALCQHKLGNKAQAQTLADAYYVSLRDTLPAGGRARPEQLLFERELRASIPPSKDVRTL